MSFYHVKSGKKRSTTHDKFKSFQELWQVSKKQAIEAHPTQWKTFKTAVDAMAIYDRPTTCNNSCYWIYGPPGTGKSSLARSRSTRISGDGTFATRFFSKDNSSIWWDAYDNQEFIVIDEFSFNGFVKAGVSADVLKVWFDPHSVATVQVKGGYVLLRDRHFTLTSNDHRVPGFVESAFERRMKVFDVLDLWLPLINAWDNEKFMEILPIICEYL